MSFVSLPYSFSMIYFQLSSTSVLFTLGIAAPKHWAFRLLSVIMWSKIMGGNMTGPDTHLLLLGSPLWSMMTSVTVCVFLMTIYQWQTGLVKTCPRCLGGTGADMVSFLYCILEKRCSILLSSAICTGRWQSCCQTAVSRCHLYGLFCWLVVDRTILCVSGD